MKLRVVYFLFFLSFFSMPVFGQEAKLSSSVSKNKLGLNQRLRIQFSINKQGADNFTPPSFTNFKVVGGPSQSVSQSWVNGKVTFSQSYTYFIQPQKKGALIIGAATVEIGGKLIKSNLIKVIVLDAVELPKNPNDPNYIANQNIHLVAEVSKSKPYVGEGVYLEHRLYISQNIGIQDFNMIEAPQYTGFWNQDIKIKGFGGAQTGTYNGESYRYIVLKKALLIPTKSGKLIIDPMKMDVIVSVPSGRADFFGNPISQNIRKEFSSAKKIIRVKELPLDEKPLDFNGAVGDFKFDVSLSRNLLKANESSQVKVAVSGKGNLKLFELPKVETPTELEVYQPERKEKTNIRTTGISGSIVDTYTIVPQFKGKYKIPNVSLSYFNPKSKKYQTITSKDLFVDVLDGKNLAIVPNSEEVAKQNVIITGKNFRYIQTKTVFVAPKKGDFFLSNWYFILLLLPTIAIPIGIFIGIRNDKRTGDIAGNKLRKAQRLAKKYLSEAKKQLGKKEAFYEALERALHNYLRAKLGIETADISKEKITQILVAKNVEELTIQQFMNVLKDSDFARYTPITDSEMEAEFEKATQVIIALDKQF